MQLTSKIILTLSVILFVPQLAAAKTYYTGKSGCSSSGGSSSQPYCTVSQGVKALSAGDTLLVKSGTYAEQVVINKSGTAGNPITIAAAPGATAVIDASNESFDEEGIITISNHNHITLRGLTVKNSPYYCIHITGAKNILVEKVKVDGCYHGGIVFDQGCDTVKALQNDVKGTDKCGEGCGTHEAITFSETTNFVAANNYVHHGIKEGIDAKDGSSNGLIYDNEVANMGQVGIYLNHATNVKIYRNKVHHTGSSAFQVAVGDLAMNTHKTDNNEIYQNEAWGNAYCGIEFWAEGSGTMANNKIYNNVLHNNGHYGIQLSDDSGQAKGNVIRNNIISKNGLGGITGNATSSNTITHNLFFQTGDTAGSNKVTGDPKFTDAANGNFKLGTGSAAIDKGFDMGLPKVGQPDIGAHEHGYTPPKPDAGSTPGQDSGPGPAPDSGSGPQPGSDAGVQPPPNPGPNPNAPADPNDPETPSGEYVLQGGCSVGTSAGAPLAEHLLPLCLILAGLLLLRRR
jgi:hypothetical protein